VASAEEPKLFSSPHPYPSRGPPVLAPHVSASLPSQIGKDPTLVPSSSSPAFREPPPATGSSSSHQLIVALRASSTPGHADLGFPPHNVPLAIGGKIYHAEVLFLPKTTQSVFLKPL